MADNIFAEIYNKILGLFGQTEKEDSKNTAVSRLRLVLMQDRTNLTPEILHRMRSELIEVLSTYVELDKEALELNFEQDGEQMALMLSIPVVRAKDEEEIQAAIKEKDAQKEISDAEETESEDGSDDADDSDEDFDNFDDESEEAEEVVSAEEENETGITEDSEKEETETEDFDIPDEESIEDSDTEVKSEEDNKEKTKLKKEEK